MKFAVVIEKGPTSYGVYAPDVPGCIAVGESAGEALSHFKEALEAHLRLMAEDGDPLPRPASTVQYISVSMPRQSAAAPARPGK